MNVSVNLEISNNDATYLKMFGRHLAEIASESGFSPTKGGVLGIVFN